MSNSGFKRPAKLLNVSKLALRDFILNVIEKIIVRVLIFPLGPVPRVLIIIIIMWCLFASFGSHYCNIHRIKKNYTLKQRKKIKFKFSYSKRILI